jgi:hypothetical protein
MSIAGFFRNNDLNGQPMVNLSDALKDCPFLITYSDEEVRYVVFPES